VAEDYLDDPEAEDEVEWIPRDVPHILKYMELYPTLPLQTIIGVVRDAEETVAAGGWERDRTVIHLITVNLDEAQRATRA
jgi:hypothetical protein